MRGISPRGALIVFEGCDRSGKTTQCKKLVETLIKNGIKAQFLRFPERSTHIGRAIDDYLSMKSDLEDHAIHLLFAANRWELVPKMKESLFKGDTLIVDRYAYSGVAFSAAKPGIDIRWCQQPERGLPKPDAVIYLTLSAEEAAKRAEFGGERYENMEFQKRVARNYHLLKEDYWQEVDAGCGIEELHGKLKDIVMEIIEKSKDKELSNLWEEEDLEPQRKKLCQTETNSENLTPTTDDKTNVKPKDVINDR